MACTDADISEHREYEPFLNTYFPTGTIVTWSYLLLGHILYG